MSAKNAIIKLDQLIELRGSIAHRVSISKTVIKGYVSDRIDFIGHLAFICSNEVHDHVAEIIRKSPWMRYKWSH